MIDWSRLQTAYGSAASVPTTLTDAAECSDPTESLDAMLGQVHFVLDSGVLNEAAPSFVAILLDLARTAYGQGRAAWPALRALLAVMESRATRGDCFGLAPGEGPPLHGDPSPLGGRLVHERSQSVRHAAIDELVRAQRTLLSSLIRTGSSEERAAALAVAVLAGADGAELLASLAHGFAHEHNPRTRCALMLGWARLAPEAPALRDAIVESVHAGGVLRAGAATAALWTPVATQFDREVLRDAVREAFFHLPAGPTDLTFDYAWHRELIGGEAARAVYASGWSHEDKVSTLASGLAASPRPPPSEYAAPEPTAAGSVAWFYLRTALRRHYHRCTIVGPEDLDETERRALRTLSVRQHNWLIFAPHATERFGIVDFVAATPRLVGDEAGPLNELVRGSWAGREDCAVRGSRARASADGRADGAPASYRGATSDDRARHSHQRSGRRGLPRTSRRKRRTEMSRRPPRGCGGSRRS